MQNATKDKFLGGKIALYQPKIGYRAGVDSVILAAACPAKAGEHVLELGMGVGAVALCLAKRTGAVVFGIELQSEYATLARENVALNALSVQVFEGAITEMPKALRQKSFDHVVMNPPYFKPERGTRSPVAGRDISFCSDTLDQWVETAARRLKPRGVLTLIIKAERLQDVLCAMEGRLGSIVILPLSGRGRKPAHHVIIQAKKGGRGALVLCASRALYQGEHHNEKEKDFTQEFTNILRHGAPLEF